MAGALMQLVAYGAQDVYLTGNPQITFFKVVYKRHTNFAMELIEQTVSGSPDFGQSARVKVSRAGDLLHDCWVRVTLPQLQAQVTTDQNGAGADLTSDTNLSYCNRVGFRLLKSVELRIGGQQIDRHTSLWMHLWTELSTPSEKKGAHGLNNLVGNKGQWHNDIRHAGAADGGVSATDGTANTDEPNPYGICGSGSTQASNSNNATGPANLTGTAGDLNLWVPLQFSFCRNPGLALPLIALQYHEVELVFELETFVNCLAHGTVNPRNLATANVANVQQTGVGFDSNNAGETLNSTFSVWGNYIFLDTEERKNFAQNPHEYLIETVQDMTTSASAGRRNYRLNFNHPVKELVWVAQRDLTTSFPYTGPSGPGNSANRITIDEAQGLVTATANMAVVEGHLITLGQSENDNTTDGATVGSTGIARGGDIFTDFTTNARTLYVNAIDTAAVHETGEGVNAAAGGVDTTLAPAASFPGTLSMVNSSVLRLNGQERFAERTSAYFNRVQPYQHHTGCPDLGINSYSFALKPEEHQPSGTCNFSRIDNAELVVDSAAAGTLSVFAHGYNVLRVASGMGGLAYSN